VIYSILQEKASRLDQYHNRVEAASRMAKTSGSRYKR